MRDPRVGSERAAGFATIGALLLAMVLANSPLRGLYGTLHHLPVSFGMGEFDISKPLILWVNDGLMVFFFLLVAVEMKREMLDGHLSTRSALMGPLIGAAGGVVVPALIYVAFTGTSGPTSRGWPVPVATDIVLVLTVLALLRDRVPASFKVFLTALAVFDDLVAILIVALYYSGSLSPSALGVAAFAVLSLAALNAAGVRRSAGYVVVGAVLWLALVRAGVHGTLAGVAVGFAVPLRRSEEGTAASALSPIEDQLFPWVAFGVVPAFAFLNSGIELSAGSIRSLADAPSLGITLGLLVGKPVGILGGVWLAVACGLASLPCGTRWRHMVGGSLAGGIGFTMSLFMAGLAFPDPTMFRDARLSVILGSALSAAAAAAVLLSNERIEESEAHEIPG